MIDPHKNKRLYRNNTTGMSGICWDTRRRRYRVTISNRHVGYYIDPDDAVAARQAAEREHGYHPNHGERR